MPLKSALNTYMVYQFIRELGKSWDEMEAFDLGIIDADGKLLKRSKDLKNQEERNAYTLFHRLVWNIKRLLNALPGGASKVKSYAAAALLLKENKEAIHKEILNLFDYDEVTEARQMLDEVTKRPEYPDVPEMIDEEMNEENFVAQYLGMFHENEVPTNVSSGVAQKDMPLCKKKKKKSKEDMETPEKSENRIASLRNKIEEGREIKRVVRGGKVRKKLSCPPGQINKGGKCVPATSKDKQRFVKAAKKRKRSMAGRSQTAALRLRKKSLRKRSSSIA